MDRPRGVDDLVRDRGDRRLVGLVLRNRIAFQDQRRLVFHADVNGLERGTEDLRFCQFRRERLREGLFGGGFPGMNFRGVLVAEG